jgi:type II secretory pathway component PulM
MPEKKKEKKKSSQCCNELANKVEIIYEILAAHKMDLEELEDKAEEMSVNIDKVKGRMGL